MSLSMAIFTFLNAWWISLFLVLPFRGEPVRWRKLLLINTGLAALITGALAFVINHYRTV